MPLLKQGFATPTRGIIDISLSRILCLRWVNTYRPLSRYCSIIEVVLKLRSDDLARRGTILNPVNHCKENIMCRVVEGIYYASIRAEGCWCIHIRRCASAVSVLRMSRSFLYDWMSFKTYCMPGTKKNR